MDSDIEGKVRTTVGQQETDVQELPVSGCPFLIGIDRCGEVIKGATRRKVRRHLECVGLGCRREKTACQLSEGSRGQLARLRQ
jgi:hypothetical protein